LKQIRPVGTERIKADGQTNRNNEANRRPSRTGESS